MLDKSPERGNGRSLEDADAEDNDIIGKKKGEGESYPFSVDSTTRRNRNTLIRVMLLAAVGFSRVTSELPLRQLLLNSGITCLI